MTITNRRRLRPLWIAALLLIAGCSNPEVSEEQEGTQLEPPSQSDDSGQPDPGLPSDQAGGPGGQELGLDPEVPADCELPFTPPGEFDIVVLSSDLSQNPQVVFLGAGETTQVVALLGDNGAECRTFQPQQLVLESNTIKLEASFADDGPLFAEEDSQTEAFCSVQLSGAVSLCGGRHDELPFLATFAVQTQGQMVIDGASWSLPQVELTIGRGPETGPCEDPSPSLEAMNWVISDAHPLTSVLPRSSIRIAGTGGAVEEASSPGCPAASRPQGVVNFDGSRLSVSVELEQGGCTVEFEGVVADCIQVEGGFGPPGPGPAPVSIDSEDIVLLEGQGSYMTPNDAIPLTTLFLSMRENEE